MVRKYRITIPIVIVIIAILISLVFVFNNTNTKNYDNKLEQAQKYVEEMDYKKAEVAYLEVINIDAKQVKGYIELSNLYLSMNKKDKAIKILNKGLKNVDKDDQKEIKDKLKKYKNEEKMYEEYAKIASKYLKAANDENIYENYDSSEYKDVNDGYLQYLISRHEINKAVCFSLYDINKDNVPELLIGSSAYTDSIYVYDAYTFVDGKAYQLMDDIGTRTGSFILCENGIIKDDYSGGYQDFGVDFYILPKNAKKLKIVDRIECKEGSYYHPSDNKMQINKEEYLDILGQYMEIDIDCYELTQENIDQCKKGNLGICKEI